MARFAWLAAALASALLVACGGPAQIQWSSRARIWRPEASQAKLRAAQIRVFDQTDRVRMLEAVVGTFQDGGFHVELLDEELGIVSGKKFADEDRDFDPAYFLFDEESLMVFTKAFRTWGPFWHRYDLQRFTVTVRALNEDQLIVRASAQSSLRPIDVPQPYEVYFRLLEQRLFGEDELTKQH